MIIHVDFPCFPSPSWEPRLPVVWTVRNEQMGPEYEFLKKLSWAFLGFDGDTKIHNQTHSDIKVETVETIQEQFHNSPMECSHPFPWS